MGKPIDFIPHKWYNISKMKGDKRMVNRPCIGCIYFKVCGSTNQTVECKGRVTMSEKRKEEKCHTNQKKSN